MPAPTRNVARASAWLRSAPGAGEEGCPVGVAACIPRSETTSPFRYRNHVATLRGRGASRGFGRSSGGSHGLHFDFDLDAFTYEHATGFEHLVPTETKVPPID